MGPLLFHTFLCDLFFIMKKTDFRSYVDHNAPYVVDNNIEDVIIIYEMHWWHFSSGFMIIKWKLSQPNCHFICSTDDKVNVVGETKKTCISSWEMLLGIRLDSKLTFDAHINGICKKASLKMNALARIALYMVLNKKRLLLNAFFISQFNYCRLVWMRT